MMLTGDEIQAMRTAGHIVIEPYDPAYVEPNSYGFHLGGTLLQLHDGVVDPRARGLTTEIIIPSEGHVLRPGDFYLGHTLERIGGVRVSAELYANRSTAAMGMWVQTSAPLGHVGAVINWTLEICVAQAVRVFPNMRLGKICFWQNLGRIAGYRGRYLESTCAVASKLFLDQK